MTERRDQQIHFRVSKVELERIRQKMESCGILSIGSYLRKMALDGYCIRLDLQDVKAASDGVPSSELQQQPESGGETGQ